MLLAKSVLDVRAEMNAIPLVVAGDVVRKGVVAGRQDFDTVPLIIASVVVYNDVLI